MTTDAQVARRELELALSGLGIVCSNSRILAALQDARDRTRKALLELMNPIARFTLGPAFTPEARKQLLGNSETIRNIEANCERGTEHCAAALDAINRGGAEAIDHAMNPGAVAWSLNLRVKVEEARMLFDVLRNTVGTLDARLTDDAERMADLGMYFTERLADLRALRNSPPTEGGRVIGAILSTADTADTDKTPARKAGEGVVSPDMSMDTARTKAEAICRSEGRWPSTRGKPSIRRMASKVGCSGHTMRKAIENSRILQRYHTGDGHGDELAKLTVQQSTDAKRNKVWPGSTPRGADPSATSKVDAPSVAELTGDDRAVPIEGSSLFRGDCAVCGEAIRVPRAKVGKENRCEGCATE